MQNRLNTCQVLGSTRMLVSPWLSLGAFLAKVPAGLRVVDAREV